MGFVGNFLRAHVLIPSYHCTRLKDQGAHPVATSRNTSVDVSTVALATREVLGVEFSGSNEIVIPSYLVLPRFSL